MPYPRLAVRIAWISCPGPGISDEMLAQTGEAFDQSFGEKGHVLADSLTEITKTTIEVGALKISVPEEMERQMEVVEVNGRKCIAIFPDGPYHREWSGNTYLRKQRLIFRLP